MLQLKIGGEPVNIKQWKFHAGESGVMIVDGMGKEVYAKSVSDVVKLLSKISSHIDDLELKCNSLVRQNAELVSALKKYREARAMPSCGDYAAINWQSKQGPIDLSYGGGICEKHGQWYGHCHCCINELDRLKRQADKDVVHARDNALRAADENCRLIFVSAKQKRD